MSNLYNFRIKNFSDIYYVYDINMHKIIKSNDIELFKNNNHLKLLTNKHILFSTNEIFINILDRYKFIYTLDLETMQIIVKNNNSEHNLFLLNYEPNIFINDVVYKNKIIEIKSKDIIDINYRTKNGIFADLLYKFKNKISKKIINDMNDILYYHYKFSLELELKSNYINYTNLKKALINKNIESNINHISLNIKKIKDDRPIFLSISKIGYKSFGGGEEWLKDVCHKFTENGFNSIYICFYDVINKRNNTNETIIKENNITYINIPLDYIYVIAILKYLQPKFIHHQGSDRELFMNISNILDIPFITGFCFWNNIFIFNNDFNIDMTNKKLEIDKSFNNIYKSSFFVYSSSKFVSKLIYKYHKKNIDVIDTISSPKVIVSRENPEFVTIINIHEKKGGWLAKYLCDNLMNIPLLIIDTEPSIYSTYIKDNINKNCDRSIYIDKRIDCRDIYKRTKILLIPSIVDETFSRVGYEGKINKIPIISTTSGNLKNLLNNYAYFLPINEKMWKDKIEELYNNKEELKKIEQLNIQPDNSLDKLYETVINKNYKKIEKNVENIAIIAPWADQGLGIQAREYYLYLTKNGYNVHIFSFKSVILTDNSIKYQIDKNEWNYPNINYYETKREEIKYEDIISFINIRKITKIIFIELCFYKIFEVAKLCKALNIIIYAIPNIETNRCSEMHKMKLFDKILVNNLSSYFIFKDLLKFDNVFYNGFRCYYKELYPIIRKKSEKINFFCCGGLNSLCRKNIDKIYDYFSSLNDSNIYLNIYIQGLETPKNLVEKPNIKIFIKERPYKNICDLYRNNDIFIHMGSHEGLGLGFFESISTNTPVLTFDTFPNNELIVNDKNGWLVKCDWEELKDNNEGITNMAKFNKDEFDIKIKHILKIYSNYIYTYIEPKYDILNNIK